MRKAQSFVIWALLVMAIVAATLTVVAGGGEQTLGCCSRASIMEKYGRAALADLYDGDSESAMQRLEEALELVDQ